MNKVGIILQVLVIKLIIVNEEDETRPQGQLEILY